MSKFVSKEQKEVPGLSTSSLPDIVFMMLFFFMMVVSMRESNILVQQSMPQASEAQKLEKKSLVSFIYIGAPLDKKLGTEARIQLNDQFATPASIAEFIASEREARDEVDRKLLTTALKVDKDVKMGVVVDVKQELRKSSAFKISYAAAERKDKR
ncbi:MAG: biopolymer transporter ExbD [Bacteroidales bacterium]|jgi:biopolymer transport protein ExbD|nr:biopolymer transporter ExbD [Bacteroidales bacterium]